VAHFFWDTVQNGLFLYFWQPYTHARTHTRTHAHTQTNKQTDRQCVSWLPVTLLHGTTDNTYVQDTSCWGRSDCCWEQYCYFSVQTKFHSYNTFEYLAKSETSRLRYKCRCWCMLSNTSLGHWRYLQPDRCWRLCWHVVTMCNYILQCQHRHSFDYCVTWLIWHRVAQTDTVCIIAR